MRLFFYSNKSHTYVEVKRAIAKLFTGGVLVGSIMFFGLLKMNQFGSNTTGVHSAITLAAENDILRQQLNVLAPRVNELEMQAGQLHECANRIQMLLDRSEAVGNVFSDLMAPPSELRLLEVEIGLATRKTGSNSNNRFNSLTSARFAPADEGWISLQMHKMVSRTEEKETGEDIARSAKFEELFLRRKGLATLSLFWTIPCQMLSANL